jgi:hypothetical protein
VLLFGAPIVACFVPFHLFYTHVHGATQANRETLGRIREVQAWRVLVHVVCILHYAGLWVSPLALALVLRRRLGEVVSRRLGITVLVLLGGYAVGRPLGTLFGALPDRPAAPIHELMPYMGNLFYLSTLGPPTLTEAYMGREPLPSSGVWLGVILTAASTLGTVAGAGLLVTVVRRARRTWSVSAAPEDGDRPALLRLLLLLFAGAYLLWHLSTGPFIFDRYLVPILPVVVLLALDAAPRDLLASPVVAACLVACGAFSVAANHEYLSWNAARDQAVRALDAQGVPAAEVDGGFEVNAPRHFEAYRQRTGELTRSEWFWLENAPYRLSFWPSRSPECATVARYPYWSWSGRDRAVYTIRCAVSGSGGR